MTTTLTRGLGSAHDGSSPPGSEAIGASDDNVITVRIGTPLDEIEQRMTMATLAQCGNVKKRAAEILGISLKTLYNRLDSYSQRDRSGSESRQAETV